MDTSGSSVDDQHIIKLCKELLLWKPTRCRGRIWCLSPETWLAFSFFFMIMGLSLINTGCFFTIDAYRKNVMKCGVCVLCSGMTILIMLTGRVKNAIYCRLLCTHNSPPKFVGVCISPPIQPEFLSAMLLPEINREWVSVDTLQGFERCHANIVHPPTQQQANGYENGEESRSKRRRNKKKKVNNSFSEIDPASRESNETKKKKVNNSFSEFDPASQESNEIKKKKVNNSFSEIDPASQESNETITIANANQEEGQLRNGDTPSKMKKQDFNKLNEYSDQKSLPKSSQPADLNPEGSNLNELIIQVKDKQLRSQKQGGNHLPSSRLYDTIYKDNASALVKVLEEKSSDYNDKDLLLTANRLMSTENSDKPVLNFITDDQQEKMELALPYLEQICAEDSYDQLNITSGHLRNITTEESAKSAEKTSSTNTTSAETQQVDPKPVSPDFITFKSKKRNRRRKK